MILFVEPPITQIQLQLELSKQVSLTIHSSFNYIRFSLYWQLTLS